MRNVQTEHISGDEWLRVHTPPRERPTRRPVIDCWKLRKSFDRRPVLSALSLSVAAGEVYGLIGPSGSGKTTTLHLLCGHLRPDSGSATVLGERPDSFSAATRRRIGYMPQNFILYEDLTVKQNVAFAAGLYGLGEWRHRARIRAVLELVELWDARKRPARYISGGMQRRLALAAALVHDPLLVFADEPTANLDPILRAKLWAHFRHLCNNGHTMLITTQYIDEAEYCDRVGLMYDGLLIAEGQPETLRQRAFGGDVLEVELDQIAGPHLSAVEALAAVRRVETAKRNVLRITVSNASEAIPVVLGALEEAGALVRSIGLCRPPFDEVFIRLIDRYKLDPPRTARGWPDLVRAS